MGRPASAYSKFPIWTAIGRGVYTRNPCQILDKNANSIAIAGTAINLVRHSALDRLDPFSVESKKMPGVKLACNYI